MKIWIMSLVVILALPVSGWSAKNEAEGIAAQLIITQIARILDRSKTMNDLASSGLVRGVSVGKMKADIKMARTGNLPVPKYTVKGTGLTLNSQKPITMDFKNFAKGELTLAGEIIDIKKPLDYAKAKVVVEGILRKKFKTASMSWIISDAHADLLDWLTGPIEFFAGNVQYAHTAISVQPPVFDRNIASNIIHAYENDRDSYNSGQRDVGAKLGFSTIIFSCKDGRLDKAYDTWPVYEGKLNKVQDWEPWIEYLPATGGYLQHGRNGECESEANKDGRVIRSSISGCPIVGTNLFEEPKFFKFTKVADSCCAYKGCYEEVSSALEKIKKEMAGIEQNKKGYHKGAGDGEKGTQ